VSDAGVWFVVVLTGVLSGAGWYLLLRTFASSFVQALVPAIWVAVVVVPAPVPDFAGEYAPAFIVVVFEGLFQSGGAPWVAVRLLLVAVCVAAAAVGLTFLALQRRHRPTA
jgi:hypothetical protein